MSQDDEPHVNLNSGFNAYGTSEIPPTLIPEPRYRLRVSVLKNGHGAKDAHSKLFSFPTLPDLTTAADSIREKFGSGLSGYQIKESGVGAKTPEQGDDVEDGRTLALTIEFDDAAADEKWAEFLGRLESVEKGWAKDF